MDRDYIIREARQVGQDLVALREAQEVIRARMRDMEAEDPERCEEFSNWACTQVLMNAFVLATVRCEGLLEDYQKLLDQTEPAQVLQLVPEKEHE